MATTTTKRCDGCGLELTGNYWCLRISAEHMKHGKAYLGHLNNTYPDSIQAELCERCVLSTRPRERPTIPAEPSTPAPSPEGSPLAQMLATGTTDEDAPPIGAHLCPACDARTDFQDHAEWCTAEYRSPNQENDHV